MLEEQEEKNRSTLEYIMHYGALLGLFWMFRYLFKIGEAYWVHFIYFYALFSIISPLLMYIFYMRYLMQTPEIKHGFFGCLIFVVGICLFGSFFESAIIFAHLSFIDLDFFAKVSSTMIGINESSMKLFESMGSFKSMSSDEFANLRSIMESPRMIKVIYILGNMIELLFRGFFFALLIGLLTRNRRMNIKE